MTPAALDIFIGLILLLSTVIAYLRGLVKEMFTLLALFLGAYFAYTGGHLLIPEFDKLYHVTADNADSTEKKDLILGILSPALASKVSAYGGMFLFVMILVSLLGWVITRWLHETGLGLLDRLLGGVFGFLRGFLLVFLCYIPATYLIDQKKMPEWATQSISLPILKSTLDTANAHFHLDQRIEDKGNGISINLEKIDLESIGKAVKPAEAELKDAIKKEENEIQKAPPESDPAGHVIDQLKMEKKNE